MSDRIFGAVGVVLLAAIALSILWSLFRLLVRTPSISSRSWRISRSVRTSLDVSWRFIARTCPGDGTGAASGSTVRRSSVIGAEAGSVWTSDLGLRKSTGEVSGRIEPIVPGGPAPL